MILRRLLYPGLTLLALVAARPVAASAITFTGNVANDFSSDPGAFVIPGLGSNPTADIAQAPWMNQNGDITGWAIKNIDVAYNQATDTLYVGVQTYTNSHGVQSIAGDAYGTGQEGNVAQQTASGGVNPPNFGYGDPTSDKSITLAFASSNPTNPSQPGTPIFVTGIPANKAANGPGIDGFNVAQYASNPGGIQSSYGATMTNNLGALAFNPSAAHPDFEFTIANFSKIPGINVNQGFWIQAYAGSAQDGAVGETSLPFTFVPTPQPQEIPEPTTVLAWTVLAGGAALSRVRRGAKARV